MSSEEVKSIIKYLRKYEKKPKLFSKRKSRECLVRMDLNQEYIDANVFEIFFCPVAVAQAIEQFIGRYGGIQFVYCPYLELDDEYTMDIDNFEVTVETEKDIVKAYEVCRGFIPVNSGSQMDNLFFGQVARIAIRAKGTKSVEEEEEVLDYYNENGDIYIDWRRAIPFFKLLDLL